MKVLNTNTISAASLKMLVLGESGVGKTTLAKTIKEPTLIISAESGLLSIAGSNIDVIDLAQDDNGQPIAKEKRIARLAEAYKFLLTEECQKKYKWVFIDSLSEISQNLIEKLQSEYTEKNQTLVMYGENSKMMRSIIKMFRDLPMYNVVFTALSTIDKDENGQRFTTVDMVGNIAAKLPAFFDEVFYLYIDAEGNRKLLTSKTDKIISKDRSGKLEKVEDADLSKIASKIRQQQPQTQPKKEK